MGTESSPGSLDAVEPWSYRPWDCYLQTFVWIESFQMVAGQTAQVQARLMQTGCGALPPLTYYFDNHEAKWRQNGVPIDETHPLLETNRVVTLADAGVYQLFQRDDYHQSGGHQYIVSLSAPAEFEAALTEEGGIQLSFRSESTGTYRLEASTNLVNWTIFHEGSYTTNRAATVQVPVSATTGAIFFDCAEEDRAETLIQR